MEKKCFIAGIPGAGKTTYIAALWDIIKRNGGGWELQFSTNPENTSYLNEIWEYWVSMKKIERSKTPAPDNITINVKKTAVDEELALANDAVRAAETVHHLVQFHNLLRCIRRTRLLAVPERRVRNPNFMGGVRHDLAVLEKDARHFRERELLTQQIRTPHIVQLKVTAFLLYGRVF